MHDEKPHLVRNIPIYTHFKKIHGIHSHIKYSHTCANGHRHIAETFNNTTLLIIKLLCGQRNMRGVLKYSLSESMDSDELAPGALVGEDSFGLNCRKKVTRFFILGPLGDLPLVIFPQLCSQ